MITDDDLRELIEGAAAASPVPAPLRTELFTVEAPRRRRHRSYGPALGTLAAVVLAFGMVYWFATVLGGSNTSNKTSSAANSISSGTADAGGLRLEPGTPSPAERSTVGATTAQVPPIADTARIIKNGGLELRVGKGAVTQSVNQLTAIAVGLGGYVADTKTTASSEAGAQATATISVRVPAAAFEQLVQQASGLGEVRSTTTSGQDVTAQFTDIDAQLTALNATRDSLLTVLGDAHNVPDILAVQDRITQVQIQIDQLEGQKRLLTDQTSYGTLSVTILEPGATISNAPTHDSSDLGDAWRKARQNFSDAVEWIVEASGTWSVVALVLALGWLVYRRVRRQLV